MPDIIDKNSKTALSTQVSEKLIASIRSGAIKPGRRMPGIRLLSKRFGTSHSTVIEALDMVEKQNYIERIPRKGTFVADDISHELSLSRLVFPFPEASISPHGDLENWCAVSEFYRGMLTEAAKLNAEISFMHFEESKTEIHLSRQLRRLNDFDGGIFVGDQLCDLRDSLIARNKPCALLSRSSSANIANIYDDMNESFGNIASLLAERGYKKLRFLSHASCNVNPLNEENKNYKIDIAIRAANVKGIISDTSMIYELKDNDDPTIDAAFAKFKPNLKDRQEAFFAINAETGAAVYRYAARNNLKIGEDFGIFGYASGITFRNLFPEFTFSKINHFEKGKAACRIIVAAVHGGEWRGKRVIVPNTLIIKKSI